MKPDCECKNCTIRKVGCHANCPDYKEFRRKLDALNKLKNADNEYEALKRDIKLLRRHMDHHKKKREHHAPN